MKTPGQITEAQFKTILVGVRDELLNRLNEWERARAEKGMPPSFPGKAIAWDVNCGMCEDFYWEVKNLVPDVEDESLDRRPYNLAHTVVKWRGKFYDAEAIDGVKRIEDLPIWKNRGKDRERIVRELQPTSNRRARNAGVAFASERIAMRSPKTIVLEPELEELFSRQGGTPVNSMGMRRLEDDAQLILGDPMYGRAVKFPKWNIPVTMLEEPRVALRYWHSWGISTSKDAHRQRAEYFHDRAKTFNHEWNDVVEQALKLYGDGTGSLISGIYRSHFPDDVKARLRFLTRGYSMLFDAARLHEYLSKTHARSFH